MRVTALVVAVVIGAATGCSRSSSPARAARTPTSVVTAPPATAPTVAPTAPPTTARPTRLSVAGYSPGVEQAPFYPPTTITSVACGPTPGGRFVLIALPAGSPGTPPGSALAEPTVVILIPGKAELKDHTGKVLYNEVPGDISTGVQGALVLSMVSTTYLGGDGRSVAQGALDISGDYACPGTDVPFPGF